MPQWASMGSADSSLQILPKGAQVLRCMQSLYLGRVQEEPGRCRQQGGEDLLVGSREGFKGVAGALHCPLQGCSVPHVPEQHAQLCILDMAQQEAGSVSGAIKCVTCGLTLCHASLSALSCPA